MYTKEEFRMDAERDMKELDLDNAFVLNGKNYYFSESENKIILYFAVNCEMGKICMLKRKYEAKYGEQFSSSVEKNGTLHKITFGFAY